MELLCNGTLLKMNETGIRFSAKILTGTDVKNLVRLEFHNVNNKLLVSITERYSSPHLRLRWRIGDDIDILLSGIQISILNTGWCFYGEESFSQWNRCLSCLSWYF